MDELRLLTYNTHQVSFALLILGFVLLLVNDIKELKNKGSLFYRRNIIFVLVGIFLGCFVTLFQAWGPEGIFFVLEFSLLVILSIIRPKYATAFFVFLLLSRPWETINDQMMQSMPREISYLAILSVFAHKILNKDFSFRFNLGTFFVAIFAFWMFLSALFSSHSTTAVTEYFNILFKGIILFVLIQNSLQDKNDFMPTKIALVIGILEKCFISFYSTFFIHNEAERLVSVGILSNSNDVAAIFVLAIPFFIFFILKTNLKPLSWIIAILAVLGMGYLIFQAQSRGAILGMIAAVASWFVYKIHSKKQVLLLIGAGVCVALVLFTFMSRSSSDLDASQSNRVVFMKAGINMGVRNPILGVGYWGFRDNLSSYILDGDSATESKMTAHSSWILPFAEGGFVAFMSYILLWSYGFFCAWQIRKSEPEYFMSLAGYAVTCTFLSHTYLLYPFILLGLVITHYQALKQNFILGNGNEAMA